tara:strand:- start:4808 stop:6094 length:1287 start_codon:yes stop_codon:yes gene_type:complete
MDKWDRVKWTKVHLSEIKSNPNNPRIIKDKNFKKLVQSLKDDPQMLYARPVIVNKDMIVLGGNMRLRALQELNYEQVPIGVADWDQEEQKAFIIKDNVSGGEWDEDILANEYDAQQLNDWGLDVPDWEEKDYDPQEDNYIIQDDIVTDIKNGDLFDIGPHRLLCGDATNQKNIERLLKGDLLDCVLTDPPYNVDYMDSKGNKIQNDNQSEASFAAFLKLSFTETAKHTKEGGAWYVWHADSNGLQFRSAFENAGLDLKQCLIWVKNTLVLGRQDYQWRHEPCLYGWKPGAAHYFTDDRKNTTVIEDQIDLTKLKKSELLKICQDLIQENLPTTVLNFDKPLKNDLHPTMKPILLLTPLILNSTRTNEIIGDFFLGSGSTMVAAHQVDRRCYAMELDPKYCATILDRMKKLDPEISIRKNGNFYEPKVN